MSDSDPNLSRPSPWPLRWDVASLVVISALSFVGILYFSFYEPTANATVSDAFVIAFLGTWACAAVAIAYGLSAAAKLGPSMLVAGNARMTTTEWHPTRLRSTYGAIDREALKAVGAPTDIVPATDKEIPAAGMNSDGQEVVLMWSLVGGGKILNFYSNPNKGVVVYPQAWICALGQGSRHIYLTPYSLRALPQAAVPADWITEFETKSEGWFKRGDPVYILHGRDPNWDLFIQANAPTIRRILEGRPDPRYGGWDAEALLVELLRAWTHINFLQRDNNRLENALGHRTALLEERSKRELSVASRPPSSEPPSVWASDQTRSDLRL